jgi:ankyrin repeat protein
VLCTFEILLDEPRKALIGLGSDDGVKLWVNGTEVHSNYIARAVAIDNDVFEISLNKGSNQILIMIQNQGFDYGFSFRALGKEIISDLIIERSGAGSLDDVKTLLGYSPDLKRTNMNGLTAWQMAAVKGRTENYKVS